MLITWSSTFFCLQMASLGAQYGWAVASVLAVNTSLTSLYLHNHSLHEESVVLIAKALASNTCVKQLSLKGSQIGALCRVSPPERLLSPAAKAAQPEEQQIGAHLQSFTLQLLLSPLAGDQGAIAVSRALRLNCVLLKRHLEAQCAFTKSPF